MSYREKYINHVALRLNEEYLKQQAATWNPAFEIITTGDTRLDLQIAFMRVSAFSSLEYLSACAKHYSSSTMVSVSVFSLANIDFSTSNAE